MNNTSSTQNLYSEQIVQSVAANLISNLENLTKQYRLLLDLVRKEKQVLIDAQVDSINELNAQKEDLIFKINELDTVRNRYVFDLAHMLQIKSEEARLLVLAQKIGGPEGDRLRVQHATLDLVINRLRVINSENAFYAESALKNINFALDNLKETLMGKKTYQKKGKYQQGADASGHLVSKEA